MIILTIIRWEVESVMENCADKESLIFKDPLHYLIAQVFTLIVIIEAL